MFDRKKLNTLMDEHVPGRRITQLELSVATGIQTSMVYRLTHEDVNPTIETLERLAMFFFKDHQKISEFSDARKPVNRFKEVRSAPASESIVTVAQRKPARRR